MCTTPSAVAVRLEIERDVADAIGVARGPASPCGWRADDRARRRPTRRSPAIEPSMSSRRSRISSSWSPKSRSSAPALSVPCTSRRSPSVARTACQRACGVCTSRSPRDQSSPSTVRSSVPSAARVRSGSSTKRTLARRPNVADQAGERAGALEGDRERVEVEAGGGPVQQRPQRRQARDLGVEVVGDGAARAVEAERGVERQLGAACRRRWRGHVRRRCATVVGELGRHGGVALGARRRRGARASAARRRRRAGPGLPLDDVASSRRSAARLPPRPRQAACASASRCARAAKARAKRSTRPGGDQRQRHLVPGRARQRRSRAMSGAHDRERAGARRAA